MNKRKLILLAVLTFVVALPFNTYAATDTSDPSELFIGSGFGVKSSNLDEADSFGSLEAGAYLTDNIGLSLEGRMFDSDQTVVDEGLANLLLRAPISDDFAIGAYGGGGYAFGRDECLVNVGGRFDLRIFDSPAFLYGKVGLQLEYNQSFTEIQRKPVVGCIGVAFQF